MTGAGAFQRVFESAAPTMQRALGAESGRVVRYAKLQDRQEGRTVAALVLSGDHAEDATGLTLREASGHQLQGKLPAGLVLTIAGTDYTVASDATAAAAAVAVTVTPGLEAAAGEGSAVAIADHVELAFPRSQGGVLVEALAEDRFPPSLVGSSSVRVTFAKAGAPGTPVRGDVVELASGQRLLLGKLVEDGEGWWTFYGGGA